MFSRRNTNKSSSHSAIFEAGIEMYGRDANDDIVLCDTPGFDDSSGAEVDVANGLGKVTFITILHLVLQLHEFRTKSVDTNKQKIPVKQPQCVSTDLYCITITQTQRLSARTLRTYEFVIASANINIEPLL